MPRNRSRNRRIYIKSGDVFDIHSSSVIRPPGGGKTRLDEIEDKLGPVKAIGIKNSGWHLRGSEFSEKNNHRGMALPAFGEKEGIKKRVIAILDKNPRVYKFPRHGFLPQNHPKRFKERLAMIREIESTVPTARFLGQIEVPEIVFDEGFRGSKGIIVEVHEAVFPKYNRDGTPVPKNLGEERLGNPDELVDIVSQIADSITKLFEKKSILFTDTNPANFVRDAHGTVKLVDFDAEYRGHPQKDLERLAEALAKPANRLSSSHKPFFSNGKELRKEIRKVVSNIVEKNLSKRDEKNKIIHIFEKNLHLP